MSSKHQSSQPSLKDLNNEVHDLHYVEAGKPAQRKIIPDRSHGWELAERIRKNIEIYRHDAETRVRPDLQT